MESDIVRQITEMSAHVEESMRGVKHKVGVMSGKGGVGKSTVTVNLALALAGQGSRVGVLDADINGPCVPKMLGIAGQKMEIKHGRALPVTASMDIKVASMDLLLSGADTPVMWKGPKTSTSVWVGAMEMSVIREFLSDVSWGDLDFLLIDLPPGAGEKPVSIAQLIPNFDGVIVVTTPSTISRSVVGRSINFARELEVPILGLIENMSGFSCPECNAEIELFSCYDSEKLSEGMGISFLGRVPFDPRIFRCFDKGLFIAVEYEDSPASKAFKEIACKLSSYLEAGL